MQISLKAVPVLACLLLICTVPKTVQAQNADIQLDVSDRILNFHSEITIDKNGKITVREHIRVYNGDGENTPGFINGKSVYYNNDIQRGIVRDFPTRYEDTSGYWIQTGFDVERVTKNGENEKFEIDELDNGKRLRIGSEDVVLAPGVYNYLIEYETKRQLIFHADKDELYWNVNGNGWVFSVDTISCTIRFPEGASIREFACYTGPVGSTASDCNARKTNENEISFTSTKNFVAYEGMTVAVSIEKGVLVAPGALQNFFAFLSANYIIPVLLLLLIFQFVYYLYVWYKKGRDPRKGIIYPQFSPPDGVTPADAGFILDRKFDSRLFAAALIDAAVKKKLAIEVVREGMIFKSNVYHFKQPGENLNGYDTTDEYGFGLSAIYGLKAEKGKYNSALRSCYTALQSALKDRYQVSSGKKNRKKGAFVLNRGYVIFGLAVLIAAAFLSIQFFTTHPSVRIGVICGIFVLLMLIIHLVFRNIMSAYTPEGRKLVDHLLGFKMYLAQAEQHVYDQLAPPEKTLDLFEKYLPYAIALEVENKWSEKFDDILQRALAEGYTPGYYHMRGGRMQHFNASEMSRNISSGLSDTVSSASTPPSSSSGGSSGRGSSGGGGGGGGGGGW